MSTLKVGIASYEAMKARTLGIARGELKPRRSEPKVWFTSVQSAIRVLSADNRALLGLIAAHRPGSIAELAKLSGRAPSNLSRTLKTMARLGLVTLRTAERGRVVPHFPYTDITLDIPITTPQDIGSANAAV